VPIACGSKNVHFLLPQVIFFSAAGDCCFGVAGAAFEGLIACGGKIAFPFSIACGGKKSIACGGK
jgi:hypothetical protein